VFPEDTLLADWLLLLPAASAAQAALPRQQA
jgi:hypothetical protein